LKALATEWANIPMLARTHNHSTRLGKEIEVFVVRDEEQFDLLNNIKVQQKFSGATGISTPRLHILL
jgi:adenylosuccinate lyase